MKGERGSQNLDFVCLKGNPRRFTHSSAIVSMRAHDHQNFALARPRSRRAVLSGGVDALNHARTR